jgi:hypothetical protein
LTEVRRRYYYEISFSSAAGVEEAWGELDYDPSTASWIPSRTKFPRVRTLTQKRKSVRYWSRASMHRPVQQSVPSVIPNESRRSFMAFRITRRRFNPSWIRGGSALAVPGLGMSRRSGAACLVSMNGGLLGMRWPCVRLRTERGSRDEMGVDMAESGMRVSSGQAKRRPGQQ